MWGRNLSRIVWTTRNLYRSLWRRFICWCSLDVNPTPSPLKPLSCRLSECNHLVIRRVFHPFIHKDIIYEEHLNHNTVSWIGTVCSVVCPGWTRPIAASHSRPLHVIHRPQCVGSVNMHIRFSCVRSQRTSIVNSIVPSIKPILSADAQLLFSVAGEGLARLDISDNTTWWQHYLFSKLFCICISATSSCLICSFIFSVSTNLSVFVLFLFLYMEACWGHAYFQPW
jgi:hypothetical protein